MKLIQLIEGPRWDGPAEGKTLYHGTTLKSAMSAMKYRLFPSVGAFVTWAYEEEMDEYGRMNIEPTEVVFAADKDHLSKVFSAMIYQVQNKLKGKTWLDDAEQITPEELLSSGAILVIREGDKSMNYADNDSLSGLSGLDMPVQIEPNDYWSEEDIVPDYIITGNRLKTFMRRFRSWPYKHPAIDWSEHRTKGESPQKDYQHKLPFRGFLQRKRPGMAA